MIIPTKATATTTAKIYNNYNMIIIHIITCFKSSVKGQSTFGTAQDCASLQLECVSGIWFEASHTETTCIGLVMIQDTIPVGGEREGNTSIQAVKSYRHQAIDRSLLTEI